MDSNFLSWVTGFYEGEGTTYFSKTNVLWCAITQNEREVLEKLKEGLGFGHVVRAHTRHIHWRWYCQSKNARRFLLLVKPYFKSNYKLTQAKKAFEADYKYYTRIGSYKKDLMTWKGTL